MTRYSAILAVMGVWLAAARPACAQDAAGIEFFETKVRPVLAENCYRCHGPEKQEGNLRLDSVAGIRQGGDRGPAIEAGRPDESQLIHAIRYTDQDLQMPPKGRLPLEQIADLEAWVKRGAPAPEEQAGAAAQPYKTFDFAQRRSHWCYQPVQEAPLPAVRDAAWPTSPIDSFILARLEQAGLQPAPPADKRTLIRRVTFDLIGLPPTPAEVETFLADESPQAWERLVNRLLDSPHYGERWARHWLDLVRYAETLGHEFDYDLFHAWRYRDYVIRAFNADVPYDQFVVEHLAGDLLADPRRHPVDGFNESILGTGFLWLGEGKHSPVDIRQEQANRIDNQIDVLGKVFLAQTIACARCHDHKFDAIAAKDYYALAGYLKSTRYQQAAIDAAAVLAGKVKRLSELKAEIRSLAAGLLKEQAREIAAYLLAATQRSQSAAHKAAESTPSNLNLPRLEAWVELLNSNEVRQSTHALYAWSRLVHDARPGAPGIMQHGDALSKELRRQADDAERRSIERTPLFSPSDFAEWLPAGDAFTRPGQLGDVSVGSSAARPVEQLLPTGTVHSGRLHNRLEGVLRSPTFTIEHPFLHFRAAGRGTRINLVIDGFTIIRNPIYGGLTIGLKDDQAAWRTMDLSMWQGRSAYIELIDSSMPNLSQSLAAAAAKGESSDAWLAIDEIRWSAGPDAPPLKPNRLNQWLLDDPFIESPDDLARAYASAALRAIDHRLLQQPDIAKDDHDPAFTLVNVLLAHGMLDLSPPSEGKGLTPLAALLDEYRQLESSLPMPTYAPAAVDGTGEDEFVFHRGNYRTPGEVAPRQLMPALCNQEQPPPERGSGRLELAQRLVDPANPLVARVMVNRIWQHHFGEGIVRTPDDFGRMGQPPTHPELLDYLAAEFVRRGWSIKQMHRLMLLSSAYRMSSSAELGVRSAEYEARSSSTPHSADPSNRLLWHMPVRRLEAEAIRDAVLAVSGRLDRTLYGESVLPNITPFMEGRGRPGASGPVDGDGRRSIYINVRRNFLTPMFLAFDYPIPFTTIGRRSTSNVPAQALAMMNGPLVAQEAHRWAQRLQQLPDLTPTQRIERMYQEAFARLPRAEETTAALSFLEDQSRRYGSQPDNPHAWTDLAHVLLNAKEFLFIE